jgi:hypothetical protein
MKKILAISILSVFAIGIIMPAIVAGVNVEPPFTPSTNCTMRHSVNIAECPLKGQSITSGGTEGKEICCLVDSIYTITDWVFYILLTLVVIMFVWGGAYYVTAAGDAEKAGKGKDIIVLAIIGIIIALLAKLAPGIIKFIIGL